MTFPAFPFQNNGDRDSVSTAALAFLLKPGADKIESEDYIS